MERNPAVLWYVLGRRLSNVFLKSLIHYTSYIFLESTCDSIALISNETYLTMHYEPLAIDGRFEPSLNGRFSVDTIAKYGCDDHHGIVYKLVGESKSICQNTGRWTRVFPEPVCGWPI